MTATNTISSFNKVLYEVTWSVEGTESEKFLVAELKSPDEPHIKNVQVSEVIAERPIGKGTQKVYREKTSEKLLEFLEAQKDGNLALMEWLHVRKSAKAQQKKAQVQKAQADALPWLSIVDLETENVKHNVDVDLLACTSTLVAVDLEYIPDSIPKELSVLSLYDGSGYYVFTRGFLQAGPAVKRKIAEYVFSELTCLIFCDARQDMPVLQGFFQQILAVEFYDVQTAEADFSDNTRRSLSSLYSTYCCEPGTKYVKDKQITVTFNDEQDQLSFAQLAYCCADVSATYVECLWHRHVDSLEALNSPFRESACSFTRRS
ncbi:hypothetical protein CYMTET_15381 [Cymbomonas tetramitiformis]|uniref:3'-5' exonuclease domain-containing protein n=1 Tax=Cymbomonas tetramitiformis TaxID=36881 RepID=A0AAE0GE40_9CHLO|nr:hypothetical protein CYMTET_15381 [Cymbomonas tetramitiformis]|eukprot:gene30975-38835_t